MDGNILNTTKKVYLLLVCYFLYQYEWFNCFLEPYSYLILFSFFIIFFVVISGEWRTISAYYSIARLDRRSLLVAGMFLLAIVAYRLSQFYLFKIGIRPEMAEVVRGNGPIQLTTPVEDLFFIGIVFTTVQTAIVGTRSQVHTMERFVMPFLISFYWFLLPHQYSNHFLDVDVGIVDRLKDFPVDILFGYACGTIVFEETRSLILSGLCHVMHNWLVWWYVTVYIAT